MEFPEKPPMKEFDKPPKQEFDKYGFDELTAGGEVVNNSSLTHAEATQYLAAVREGERRQHKLANLPFFRRG